MINYYSQRIRRWVKIPNKQIGQVTHYYDKIAVAVIKLTSSGLKVGDNIKFVDKGGDEFTQEVSSMQIEHANIDLAKSGDEFGLKVTKPVKPGSAVYKL